MTGTTTAVPLVWRVLGDLAGGAVLAALVAALVALVVYLDPAGGTLQQGEDFFVVVYVVLLIPGYVSWLQMEKDGDPRWLQLALISVGVGAVFFAIDVTFGMIGNPSQSVFSAAASTGFTFGITLLVCPGFVFIAVAGWARSLLIRLGARISI